MNRQAKVICLMGPTASGKTDVAVHWAEHSHCDIVSVDSALIYRGMDIGTAKPDAKILVKAPHRLIDILDPAECYSAADFCRDAINEIQSIIAQDRIPLLVGGTMLYFKALQQGLAELPAASPQVREQLDQQIKQQGLAALYQQLKNIDPKSAKKIQPNDKQRIQRALEVYELTGTPMSQLQQQSRSKLPYQFINYAIMPADRVKLHERIATRFHNMLQHGFIDEVEVLKQRGDLSLQLPSMRAVGYRQVWQMLDGDITQAEMIEQGIAATRQLAKRQLTWLRRWPNLHKVADAKQLYRLIFSEQ